MSATGISIAPSGWQCAETTCGARMNATREAPTVVATAKDLAGVVLRLAPNDPSFYDSGWSYKAGADRGLTFCGAHALHAMDCTCGTRDLDIGCYIHSDIADVRTSHADMLDPPRRVHSLLDWQEVTPAAAAALVKEAPPFVHRGRLWTLESEPVSLWRDRVRWSWQMLPRMDQL